MMIILPKQNENIQLLLRDLQRFHLNDILNGLQETEIFLDLPRFNIQYEADLSSALKNVSKFRLCCQIVHFFGFSFK